ncbi:hypothetical protein ASF49_08090 [Methylobacterium sp. Leaf104]|uniref:hypothetical protein n=1 Tax=Methylobacterium TaxID=407 RepID=UPI0006F458A6|nr:MULTISPECIES: hypothetical protein [Methylobacterium]KQP33817.1 hypothetical protein ASF49_08090 [Methylobacterium sp. Leaf104]MCI9879615.1 hypothetical protein [Methylobacterium goesingense]
MAGAVFKPLDPKLLNKPSGQCAFQLRGTSSLIPFGHATATFKKSSTKTEIRTPEEPGNGIIATDYGQLTGGVDVEFGTMNTLGLALSHLANVKPFTQALVPAKDQSFPGVMVNEWLELKAGDTAIDEAASIGLIGTVVTSVTVGGEVIPPATYRHDSKSGVVQIVVWPEGADVNEDVVVSFSAPAVMGTASTNVVELLQTLSLTGRFFLRQNNLRGTNRKIVVPQLTFGGEGGDVQWIADGSGEVVKATASGSMEADYTQKAGYEYGYMIDLL